MIGLFSLLFEVFLLLEDIDLLIDSLGFIVWLLLCDSLYGDFRRDSIRRFSRLILLEIESESVSLILFLSLL